jgi:hypothetical protein
VYQLSSGQEAGKLTEQRLIRISLKGDSVRGELHVQDVHRYGRKNLKQQPFHGRNVFVRDFLIRKCPALVGFLYPLSGGVAQDQ